MIKDQYIAIGEYVDERGNWKEDILYPEIVTVDEKSPSLRIWNSSYYAHAENKTPITDSKDLDEWIKRQDLNKYISFKFAKFTDQKVLSISSVIKS